MPCPTEWCLSFHFVALDYSVLDVDDAVSISGDVIFMGDQDDRIALRMKAIEERHDFVAGL